MAIFKGSGVALVTPFKENLEVDYEQLRKITNWHVEHGTDAIIVCGTTGEASTLTEEEHSECIAVVAEEVNGRIPVIAGTGSNATYTAVKLSKEAEQSGVDGLLVVTPYYNKATQNGLIRHYTEIANAVSVPIIMYNVPGRTGCSLSVSAVERLSKHPNIIGIKEASGNISFAVSVSRYISDDFAMWSGNDDMIVPILSLGGSGVISVFANTNPQEAHDLVQNWLDGNHEESLAIQQKYLDYIHALFCEVNPIPVKEALNQMGKEVGGYRLPLYPMAEKNRQHLIDEMKKAGII